MGDEGSVDGAAGEVVVLVKGLPVLGQRLALEAGQSVVAAAVEEEVDGKGLVALAVDPVPVADEEIGPAIAVDVASGDGRRGRGLQGGDGDGGLEGPVAAAASALIAF